MERQYSFNESDDKWDTVQFRIDPGLKKDMQIWCKTQSIPFSVLLRLICKRILSNRQTFPGYQKEPTTEITAAVGDVQIMLPVVVKQRGYDQKIY